MKTIYKTMLVLLFLTVSLSFAQTGVTVTYYNGTVQQYNVAATGKLYFANDDLYVKVDAATTPTTIPVGIIRKVTFSGTLATATFGENRNNLVLYPNPSSDVIKINADSFEELDVKIYSLTGQLVQQGNFAVNQEINVSGLSRGLYLVQVNGVTIKFSKK